MNDHLPECPKAKPKLITVTCICPALRACEQRVRDESADDLTITRGVNYAHGYADGYAKGRKDAYAAGLDAAREAVANAPRNVLGYTNPPEVYIRPSIALAAIDALREVEQ